ncbi:MAG: multidrug efflux MFS transporter [Elusimicrobiota bacterium]|jgi:EmrB/QacA subfamily drug resistance transporter|nr:multidrug efflux MFS transporter [Elusimicrobiota bacterium]
MENRFDPKLLKIAFILIFGMFAPALDATIVNVAIKTISAELNTTIPVVQWITTAYILVMGIAVPVAGWLDNRFSAKKIYLISIIIFLIGSIFASLAWSIESLIAFRIIQGLGAGIMLPTLQTSLIQYSDGKNLGALISIVSIPTLIIPILGPVLGGFLINNLPWRWIFYVNIPVSIIAFFLALKLPETQIVNKTQRLDIIGSLLLSGTFILLILGISKMRQAGGLENQSADFTIIFAIVLLIVFIFYSLRTKKEPAVDMRLFKFKSFTSSSILLFVSGIISIGTLFILPLFFQQVRNQTPLMAGLMLAPQGVGMLLTRGISGKLTDQIGARFVVIVSLILVLLGTFPFMFDNAQTKTIWLILSLLIRGAGLGGVVIPIMASIYSDLTKEQISNGTVITRILQQIGGAFGTAVLAMVLQHYFLIGNSGNIAKAYNMVFFWSACWTVISIIPAFFLPIKTNGENKS